MDRWCLFASQCRFSDDMGKSLRHMGKEADYIGSCWDVLHRLDPLCNISNHDDAYCGEVCPGCGRWWHLPASGHCYV